MKNYKFVVAMIVMGTIIAGGVFAQEAWYNSYAEGIDQKVLINAGIGFGPTGGYNMGVPPLSLSADFKLPIKVPITVGGIFTYTQWKYSYNWGSTYDFRWHNIGFGARGMYHFNFVKNLDVYTGLTLGYVIQTFDGGAYNGSGYGGTSFFLYGFNVGARYFFTKNIDVYLETGYSGLQFVSLGLSVKL
ncbi:hypothetical protein FACS189476_02820 [Spirochaetia bacterium]|nr:hypothetical protein FACS189476_02820 [Spirochaetia bacterium]